MYVTDVLRNHTQFPDETRLTVTWRPQGDEKAPRGGAQALQWAKMASSRTIGEAVKKGAERLNILYNWRRGWLLLDGKKSDKPVEK